MPPRGRNSDVVRLVGGARGRVAMRTELVAALRLRPTVPGSAGSPTARGPRDRRARHGRAAHAGAAARRGAAHGRGVRRRGRARRCRSCSPTALASAPPPDDRRRRARWRTPRRSGASGRARCRTTGEWAEAVRALADHAQGADLRARPAASSPRPPRRCPSSSAAPRNWDYRYCWLRDATLTLLALMDAGYYDEASAWRDWLLRAAAGQPAQLQIMYGVAGERRLPECELPGCPATRARGRCASATPRTASCSSTSSAR